jgi:hypothetical protein
MSSAVSSTVADVSLKPSLRALRYAQWLHMLVAVALPFATSDARYALPLLGLIGASWIHLRRHAALGFGNAAVRRIVSRQDGSWWIESAADSQGARLLPDSVVMSRLLVLRFRADNAKVSTRLILGDEADAEALRRLRMQLLAHRGEPQPGSASEP